MPIRFENAKQYVTKLKDIIETEGTIERIKSESYAEEGVDFKIIEHKDIVMWIDLDLPRDTDLKSIRDGVLLQVLIKQKRGNKHYTALGIIKKLVHFPSEDRKVAHLQIDLMNPLDKKKRQPILQKDLVWEYETELAFRVRFDDTQIKAQIR